MPLKKITKHSKPLVLPKLYLASTSPRRRQILSSLGLKFKILSPKGDEAIAKKSNAYLVATQNAYDKAHSVHASIRAKNELVIGADTIVVLKNSVLGKPKSTDEAREMLWKLSGITHEVVTGFALISKKHGTIKKFHSSKVKFKTLKKRQVEDYLETIEPYDKAGSYAIQGYGALFIDSIKGSYTNVMGFPIEAFLVELEKLTKTPLKHWFS